MILTIITSDFSKKCGNCKYFKTENNIDGECINLSNKLKPWNRQRYYNSKSCKEKEIKESD